MNTIRLASLCILALTTFACSSQAPDESSDVAGDHLEASGSAPNTHAKAIQACTTAHASGGSGNQIEMQTELQTWNDCLVAANDAIVPMFKSNAPRNTESMASAFASLRESAALGCDDIMDHPEGAEGALDLLSCTGSFEQLLATMIDGYGTGDLGFASVSLPIGSMASEHPNCAPSYEIWQQIKASGGIKVDDLTGPRAESAMVICMSYEIDGLAPYSTTAGEQPLTTKLSPTWSADIDTLCDRFVHSDDVNDDSQDADARRLAAAACHIGEEAVLFHTLKGLVGAR